MFLALRRGEAEDEHVLGHPAFLLRDDRRDAQGETFLAQQRVAAVTRPVGPDRRIIRKMNDIFFLRVRLARPGDVLLAGEERRANRVQAGNELAVRAEIVEHRLAHARHQAHVDHDIRGVGDFDADLANRRIERSHGEGNHVHRSSLHAAVEETKQGILHLRGLGPIVGRAGFIACLRADERAVLHARNVARMRTGEVATGAQLFI